MNTSSVTVVIPSILASDSILGVVSSLTTQTTPPSTIAIVYTLVVPPTPSVLESLRHNPSVDLYPVPFSGQVRQRCYGSTTVFTDYTLFLDDDVILPPDAIHTFLSLHPSPAFPVAIGPLFFNASNGRFVTQQRSRFYSVYRIFTDSIIGGVPLFSSKHGTISPALQAFGHPPSSHPFIKPCQFLAGGCIFMPSRYTLKSNFYPFKGKAYSEDVLHSLILRNAGITLLSTNQVAATIFDSSNASSIVRRIIAEYRVKCYISRKFSFNSTRLLVLTLFTISSILFLRATRYLFHSIALR